MEVWKIVPPRKVLSFNLEKQLLDDERTTKQQTYSLPGMTNAFADVILKKLRFRIHILLSEGSENKQEYNACEK